jgi:CDP-diacylglycerol--serine O-phosphatidyltransferase
VNLRKTFFILPNLFTLSSVFCGFFAIATIANSPRTEIGALYQAAIAICFGFFFDLADGRVARLTRTQSALGLQLDSLADVITFGVAPSLMVYRWGLDRIETHHLGMFISFLFCGAGALRLARFNVLAMKESDDHKTPGKYILGLPVPAAAAVLVALVVANHQLGGSFVDVGQAALALVVVVLSYLMVSRIRFRSFKDLKVSRRSVTVAGVVFGGAAVAIFRSRVPSAVVFIVLVVAYLSLGLFEELVFFRRRRAEERVQVGTVVEADGGARSDEEVLEELGAYDGESEDRSGAQSEGAKVLKAQRR